MSDNQFHPPPRPERLDAATLSALPDEALEQALLEYVLDATAGVDLSEPEALNGLSKPLRAWYLAFVMDAEVLNGGFNQYFFNPSGVLAGEAPAALRTIGLDRAAELVDQALILIGQHAPALEKAVEEGTIEAFMATYIDQPFEALDEQYAHHQEEFRIRRIAFTREHLGALLQP